MSFTPTAQVSRTLHLIQASWKQSLGSSTMAIQYSVIYERDYYSGYLRLAEHGTLHYSELQDQLDDEIAAGLYNHLLGRGVDKSTISLRHFADWLAFDEASKDEERRLVYSRIGFGYPTIPLEVKHQTRSIRLNATMMFIDAKDDLRRATAQSVRPTSIDCPSLLSIDGIHTTAFATKGELDVYLKRLNELIDYSID